MVGREGSEQVDAYGMTPWVVGVLLAVLIFVIMFSLAQGFA